MYVHNSHIHHTFKLGSSLDVLLEDVILLLTEEMSESLNYRVKTAPYFPLHCVMITCVLM